MCIDLVNEMRRERGKDVLQNAADLYEAKWISEEVDCFEYSLKRTTAMTATIASRRALDSASEYSTSLLRSK